MPSSLQTLDTSFPKIDDHQTTEENFLQVTNYLYMLLENLRYTLGNLGEENFNDTELEDIAKMIREPVWARIEDTEGNINTLNVTAENLLSQISSLDGSMSTLQQTSKTLMTRVQNAEGDLSSLTQTVNGFRLSVTNGDDSSTISLTSNGAVINSQTIRLTGMVTVSDLSTKGKTTIHGGNITTGTLDAENLSMKGLLKLEYDTNSYGWMGYNTTKRGPVLADSTARSFFIATKSAAKLSYNDEHSVYATGNQVALQYGTNHIKFTGGAFYSENNTTLGTATYKWGQGYSSAATFQTSDRNAKNSIENLDGRYLALFDKLRPVRFKFNDGTSGRFHVGFIAQEVASAMSEAEVGADEFGGFGKDVHEETGEDIYMLRYEEFVAILALKIKQQDKRIQALEEAA